MSTGERPNSERTLIIVAIVVIVVCLLCACVAGCAFLSLGPGFLYQFQYNVPPPAVTPRIVPQLLAPALPVLF